ncbi:hypothetical protein ACHQM5_028086 [Ranunculus cassubicifolius]
MLLLNTASEMGTLSYCAQFGVGFYSAFLVSDKVEVEEDPSEVKKNGEDDKVELRNPNEVTTDEYNDFYKNTFNEYLEPLASSHFTIEGEVEFRSILYVPAIAPKDDVINSKTKNIKLYVKRVFISDDFDGEMTRMTFHSMSHVKFFKKVVL